MKRLSFFLAILLAVVLIGLAIWLFFFRQTPEDTGQPFAGEGDFGTFFDTSRDTSSGFGGIDTLDPEDFVRETRIPILRQLSAEPVAGYTFFKKEFESLTEASDEEETLSVEEKLVFRFMERATGHILETTEDATTASKVTNQTLQKINKSLFSADGDSVIFAKLSDNGEGIDSFLGEVVENEEDGSTSFESQPYSILASFFENNSAQNSFTYLVKASESASIFTDDFEGLSKTELLNLPIKDFLINWENPEDILITTRPSSGEPGFAYLVDTTTGSYEKVLGEIPGLTTKISPDGQFILFSGSEGNSVTLGSKNVEEGTETRLSLSTMPEKCTFSLTEEDVIYCGAQSRSATGEMPDDWYKGKFSFDDVIWKVNVADGSSTLFYGFNREKYGLFDMIDLRLTEDDKYLTFQNKRDLTLWSLNIEELNNSDNFISDDFQDF